MSKNNLIIVESKDIDRERWDHVISQSTDLLYPFSWYLDAVCESWSALIYKDYQFIIPIPLNKKLVVFQQIYQPYYCQQLGIFGKNVSPHLTRHIHRTLASKYVRIRYNSHQLPYFGDLDEIKVKERPNYILNLNKSYKEIFQTYHTNHKRNLKKAKSESLLFEEINDVETFLDFYLHHLERKVKGIRKRYHHLHQLLLACQEREKITLIGVKNREGALISANAVLTHEGRLTNLLPVSSQEGIDKRAMYFLLDYLFEKYAGSDTVFDFEGSFIPGIARFFAGFGASKQTYYHLRKDYFRGFKKD